MSVDALSKLHEPDISNANQVFFLKTEYKQILTNLSSIQDSLPYAMIIFVHEIFCQVCDIIFFSITDSGGFQMVSLLKLAQITEEGVKFTSPYDNSEMNMTPEHSMEIQVSTYDIAILTNKIYSTLLQLYSSAFY